MAAIVPVVLLVGVGTAKRGSGDQRLDIHGVSVAFLGGDEAGADAPGIGAGGKGCGHGTAGADTPGGHNGDRNSCEDLAGKRQGTPRRV